MQSPVFMTFIIEPTLINSPLLYSRLWGQRSGWIQAHPLRVQIWWQSSTFGWVTLFCLLAPNPAFKSHLKWIFGALLWWLEPVEFGSGGKSADSSWKGTGRGSHSSKSSHVKSANSFLQLFYYTGKGSEDVRRRRWGRGLLVSNGRVSLFVQRSCCC